MLFSSVLTFALLVFAAHAPARSDAAAQSLSTAFQTYINQTNPQNWALLTQPQLASQGVTGSFGGGNNGNTFNNPVLLVVGDTSFCANYTSIQSYFLAHNYSDNEVYCTTYWSGNYSYNEAVRCLYPIQINIMIINIAGYTGKTVTILAYSMGTLVARKAIIGGPCVDDPSSVLPSVRNHVKRYVSIAGPNHGLAECNPGKPLSGLYFCNHLNGFYCNSSYIQDINNNTCANEPGNPVDTIYSTTDDTIGSTLTCGSKTYTTGTIPCQNTSHVVSYSKHTNVIFSTVGLQWNITKGHIA